MTREYPLLFLLTAVAFAGGIAVAAAVAAFVRFVRAWRIRRRFRRGAEGEREALRYLRHRGFTVDNQQAEMTGEMLVDGTVCPFTIRADYLGARNGKRCVIEVKTGKQAVDPVSRDTRRQLLEYALWYDVDNVYLFNADDAVLHEIAFPVFGRRSRRKNFIVPFVCGLLCGAAVCALIIGRY